MQEKHYNLKKDFKKAKVNNKTFLLIRLLFENMFNIRMQN